MLQEVEMLGGALFKNAKSKLPLGCCPSLFSLSHFIGTLLASNAHYLLRAVILCSYMNGFQMKLGAARNLLTKFAGRVTCKFTLDSPRNYLFF